MSWLLIVIKDPSTLLGTTDREGFYVFKNERLPCLLPTPAMMQPPHFVRVERLINNSLWFDANDPYSCKAHQG
jgi:hypothetical protein